MIRLHSIGSYYFRKWKKRTAIEGMINKEEFKQREITSARGENKNRKKVGFAMEPLSPSRK